MWSLHGNREIKFGALLERLPATAQSPSWFATGTYAFAISKPKSLRLLLQVTMHANHGLLQPPASVFPRGRSSIKRLTRLKIRAIIYPPYLKEVFAALCFLWETLRSPRSAKLQGSTASQLQRGQRAWGYVSLARSQSLPISYVIFFRPHALVHWLLTLIPASYIPPNPGPIIDLTTKKMVGQHSGLWSYTVGEKAKIRGMVEKMFVAKKDTPSNTIYVVPGR